MTQLSQEIFDSYQIRKTKKQKDVFIRRIQTEFPQAVLETGGLLRSRNIVIGDIETAKVVFSAHYDTCAVLPFPNFLTPKNFLLYLLYNLLILAPIFAIAWGANFLVRRLTNQFWLAYWISIAILFGILFLLFAGKPNRHTANDNTSGVITLLETLQAMQPKQQAAAAFVLFDNEELGMFGSSLFQKRHKKQMQNKLLVNLDCVSDGDYILVIRSKSARRNYDEQIQAAFPPAPEKYIQFEKASNTFYPSDQINFPNHVGIAAFQKKRVLGLYMDKIHTKHDTVFDERNIAYLRDSLLRFAGQFTEQTQ